MQNSYLGFSRVCVVALSLASGLPVWPQDTRDELIAQRQEQKSKDLRHPEPNKVEKLLTRMEEGGWILSPSPRGFYPYFDSVYPGGGLTLGAGYRKYVADYAHVDARGLYSFKNYKLIEGLAGSPNHLRGRLDFQGRVGWRDATQIGFYGVGRDSKADDRANFRLNETYVEGSITAKPLRWIHLSGGVSFEDYREKQGKGSEPSIEEEYDASTAPFLGSNPSYVHSQIGAAIVWQESPGYGRKGGLYRLSFHDFRNMGSSALGSFQIRRGELVQHIPILRENWVLSLRGRVESVMGTTSDVPYFLLPYLGSGSTLRGYMTGRFRDRHAMLMTGELRWIPNRLGLDMAVFYDAGDVAPNWSALRFNGMKHDVGVGIRFHSPALTFLRFDVAHGSDGWHMVISSSGPF
jgi:hypothetical protein